MTQKSAFPFGSMIPGFDFMQQLASSGTGSTVPGLQDWIAPTVNIDELDRRIKELKTVQFWLEQNLLGIQGTIQALEVQKMTLQTLQGMNLGMAEIAKAFTLPIVSDAADATEGRRKAAATSANEKNDGRKEESSSDGTDAETPDEKTAAAMADPMQWWGALSQQFQQIAVDTMQQAAQRVAPPPPTESKAPAPPRKSKPKTTASKKTAGRKAAAAKSTRGSAADAKGSPKTTPKK